MVQIRVETRIAAPVERCFDLARSQEAHVRSTEATGERIVSGPPNDLLEIRDELTFEAKHLGFRWRLRARIVKMDQPLSFVDEMVTGPFARLRHTHLFEKTDQGTLMTDLLELAAPLGPLGLIAEWLFLERHMRQFLTDRGLVLKQMAEQA